ncbi:MAG: hypothetical protein JW839_14375 [Candidatus Lokiarchaeota archaeon]|nr:hypothetical protein [Candidatus Lokiarchaeota archaeon]
MSDGNRDAPGDAPAGLGFTYNKAGGYGVLLARCNCCGGMLHLNITRHGYVTLDCEDLGGAKGAPCRHAVDAGGGAGHWAWTCACPPSELARECANRQAAAVAERERIRGEIEAFLYAAAMSRQFVVLDLRDDGYVDFEPAVVDAANMSFTIDGKGGQRPYLVLVRRFYVGGENVSSRFVFFKKTITTTVLAAYAKPFLSFMAKRAKRFPLAAWVEARYELL